MTAFGRNLMIVLCAAYGFVQSVSRLPIAISADQRDRKSTHSSRARSATAASCSPGAVLRGNGGSPANGFQPALHTTGDTEGHDREAQQGASGIDLPQGRQRRTSLLLAESHLTRRLFGSMLRRIAALPGRWRLSVAACGSGLVSASSDIPSPRHSNRQRSRLRAVTRLRCCG